MDMLRKLLSSDAIYGAIEVFVLWVSEDARVHRSGINADDVKSALQQCEARSPGSTADLDSGIISTHVEPRKPDRFFYF